MNPYDRQLMCDGAVALRSKQTSCAARGGTATICPRPLEVVTWTATESFPVGGNRARGGCGSSYSIRIPSLKFVGLSVLKIWLVFGHGVKRPVTLTFELSTSKWGDGVTGFIPAIFSLLRPSILGHARDNAYQQWCKQDQILKTKTKTKTKITRPRPPEVNKATWQI